MGDLSPFAQWAKGVSIFLPRHHFIEAKGISPIITGMTVLRSLPLPNNRTHPLRGIALLSIIPQMKHRVHRN